MVSAVFFFLFLDWKSSADAVWWCEKLYKNKSSLLNIIEQKIHKFFFLSFFSSLIFCFLLCFFFSTFLYSLFFFFTFVLYKVCRLNQFLCQDNRLYFMLYSSQVASMFYFYLFVFLYSLVKDYFESKRKKKRKDCFFSTVFAKFRL